YKSAQTLCAKEKETDDLCLSVAQWEPYQEGANDIKPLDALKAIETYMLQHSLTTLQATTQIIITPAGYDYKIVKALVTNFHQPQSTLLLLVSALIGDDWHKVYDYALANDFRFLSYGDSSLLIP
ncbi:MAG: S-adenosylmethionine:tRNA ribosyltransferase-isomerase, partial [Prevotella sp.]|nr:S-adenosylmethionine:tRNA ribosyltransferase-isomerase [Prevotella sp.]